MSDDEVAPQEEDPAETPDEVDLNADVELEEVTDDPNTYPDPDNPIRGGPF